MLKTKSIQKKASKDDGIRICIMRRPDILDNFNIWMPELAPSHQLLTDYHKGIVDWQKFVTIFNRDVLQKKHTYISILIDIALKHTVTILCWEETPDKCHRRLVAEECKKINPKLEIKIK